MNNRIQKIESLRVRLQQLEAAEKAADARARAAANARTRAEDTRRKVLIGAFVLDQLTPAGAAAFQLRGASFDAWLKRADDRALFGLTASAEGAAAAALAMARHQLSLGEG